MNRFLLVDKKTADRELNFTYAFKNERFDNSDYTYVRTESNHQLIRDHPITE